MAAGNLTGITKSYTFCINPTSWKRTFVSMIRNTCVVKFASDQTFRATFCIKKSSRF